MLCLERVLSLTDRIHPFLVLAGFMYSHVEVFLVKTKCESLLIVGLASFIYNIGLSMEKCLR